MADSSAYGANAAQYDNRHDTRDGGVGGGNTGEEMYDDPRKPPKDADEGAVAAATVAVCAFTRRELHDLLKESRFGAEVGAYNAYFKADPSGDGGHVCRVCALPIGVHGDGSSGAAAAGGAAQEDTAISQIPKPNVCLADAAKSGLIDKRSGSFTEMPTHFSKTAWYARFLEFDAYEGVTSDVVGGGKHRRVVNHAKMRWRCAARDAHGHECGAKFVTRGLPLDTNQRAETGTAANFNVLHADAEAIEKHFNDVHLIEHVPAGRWTTSLFGCCGDPKACCSCMLCYVGGPVCCLNGYGYGFFNTLESSAPRNPEDFGQQAVTHFTKWDECQCSPNCFSLVWLPLGLYHATALFIFAFAGTLLTLGGFPCNSDKLPPIMCWPCFARRRRMVDTLESGEHPCATRAAVVFCCPCSEVQQWRELRNSGVWPGLACCTASEADRAAMAPSAVRARYAGADGAYGVRAQVGAGRDAAAMAASLLERKGPAVMLKID